MNLLSESEVREIIWTSFARKIDLTEKKEYDREVARRKKEVHQKLGEFNRHEYFTIFNTMLKECFFRVFDRVESLDDHYFLAFLGYGTEQWSDDSFNIMEIGTICGNMCLYCYVSGIFNHYGWVDIKKIIVDLEEKGMFIVSHYEVKDYCVKQPFRIKFKSDLKKVNKSWSKIGLRKLFMSPTSHDIFPENVHDIVKAWKTMLKAGHYILVVSKPLFECIKVITDELQEFKERIAFRFTITTEDQSIADKWEIFAPLLSERIECVRFVRELGYKISISMEPMLSNIDTLIDQLSPIVDEIWVGTMNGYPSEKVFGIPFCDEIKKEIWRLKELYQLKNLERLIGKYRENEKVQWKESFVKAIIKRNQNDK